MKNGLKAQPVHRGHDHVNVIVHHHIRQELITHAVSVSQSFDDDVSLGTFECRLDVGNTPSHKVGRVRFSDVG
ncbi:hypothetical protein D3C72_2357760 [compost metagenome]